MNVPSLSNDLGKTTLDLDIPLDAGTQSESGVAELVGRMLNEISRLDHRVSHSDILQALAITTAVRAAMAEAAAKTGVSLSLELLDIEVCPERVLASYDS